MYPKITKILLFILTTLFIFLSCREEDLGSKKIKPGQTKKEIIEILNIPGEINRIEKTTDLIWGAEEKFWDELIAGTSLEVWYYPSGDSILQLYFLQNDSLLLYKLTVPKGVIYETTP